MKHVSQLIIVVAVCAALLIPIPAAAQQAADRASTLTARMDSLRMEGTFMEALVLAKELMALREADASSKPFEVAEAKWRLSSVELAVTLPAETRQELAEAYGLDVAIGQHFQKAEYDKGLSDAQRQSRIFEKVFGHIHPDVANSLNNQGALNHGNGDFTAAGPLYREALEIWSETLGPDHPYVANGYNNVGAILEARGDYADAERHYLKSLKIWREALGPNHPDVAQPLNNLGTLNQRMGDYADAELYYRESLGIWRKNLPPNHLYLAVSLNNLALLLKTKDNYAGAEPLFREALAIRRKALKPDHPHVAASLSNLAALFEDKGDYAVAEPLYREALAIWRETLSPDHPYVATGLNNLAHLLENKGDYEEAEPLYREALAIRRKTLGPDHPDVATSLSNLAVLLQAKGDYAGAEPLYREGLEIRRKALGLDHPYVATSLNNLGSLLHAKGDYAGAEHELSQAADVYEVCRLRVGNSIGRAVFQASPYPELAIVRLETGKTSDAWPAVERYSGRVLMDLLIAAESRPLTRSEAAREDSLKRELDDLERELAAYQKASVTDTTGEASKGFDETRDQLIALEAEWAKFQREMSRKYPVAAGQPYPLDKVQKGLDNETAILGWLDVRKENNGYGSWAYVIRDKGPVVWTRLEYSEGDVEASPFDRMRVFRDRLASVENPRVELKSTMSVGKDCGSERLSPLSETLKGVKHLVVIPSGAMLGVPVEALVDPDGTYIGDRYVISYIPSATIYTWLKERGAERKKAPGQSLLVGDPPFSETQLAAMANTTDLVAECAKPTERNVDKATLRYVLAENPEALSSLDRLPCTRLEVQAIAPMLPEPTLLVGPEASEQEMVELAEAGRLEDFQMIHLATHAFVDDERPERSALILSRANLPDPLEAAVAGERIYDGLVTAKEIVHEWKLDADLVTLSACETGLGKVVGGEGYVGFAHAFLQAGARSLMVSLWKVEDRATRLLMQRFYENWMGRYSDARHDQKGEPMSKAESLQEAKQYLRTYMDENGERPFEHPYFWSAFVIIGDQN